MKTIWLSLALALAACDSAPEDDPALRQAFSEVLKDPSSIQFENVGGDEAIICGRYNSKNSYGAYSGFRIFAFDRATEELWLEDGVTGEVTDNYRRALHLLYSQCSE